jgi:5-methylcytosine-specific restriction endonuclease McrA
MGEVNYLLDLEAARRSREHPRKEGKRERKLRLFKAQTEAAIASGIKVQKVAPQPSWEARPERSKRSLRQELEYLRDKVERLENARAKTFYDTREWRELRWKVLRKSDMKCQACGRSRNDGIILHVDHIQPRSKFPHLELVESNLQVLCEDCNIGKSNT